MDTEHIEPPFQQLVDALHLYPSLTVTQAFRYLEPETEWTIVFNLDHNEDGWMVLEFLAWAINHDMRRAGSPVALEPKALPPHLNQPGKMLWFQITSPDMGPGDSAPDMLASYLTRLREDCFVTHLEASAWDEEPPSMN